jgi:serine/threonine protein kinase
MSSSRCGRMRIIYFIVDGVNTMHLRFSCFRLWRSPAPEILKRLEHEYSLKLELDPTWATRPIAMARHWDRTVLVLKDPGGVPLDQLLGQPLEAAFSLRLAISLSRAIDHLHQRDIIHKDIKPANVLVNSVTGRCWLMGFGIAPGYQHE